MQHPARISRRPLLLLAAASGAVSGARMARAQQWPARPVTFVVAFVPGTGTDMAARYYATRFQELTNQSFIVENRAGANGFIGAQAVLKAPPDGYTLFFASGSSMATNVALFKNMPYDPVADFAPIGGALRSASLIVVPANSPFKSVADLVAAAKAKPRSLSYGSSSSAYQIATEYFAEVVGGIEMLNIPYKGTTQAINDTMSGTIDLSFASVIATAPLVKSGKLRALAVTSDRRNAQLPDVPTAHEAGAKGFEFYAWTALFAPVRTPRAITDKLADLMARINAEPATEKFFKDTVSEAFPVGPQELRKHQLEEIELWKRTAQRAGVQPE